MALPHLLKYVYTHGTDEVIRRGKKIHAIGYVELAEHDDLFGSAVFRVKDDNYATFYKVHVQNYKDAKNISLRCACPYNLGEICRHEAAAMLRLQEMIDKGLLQAEDLEYDQQHTVAKMKSIEIKTLRLLSDPETFIEAEKYLQQKKPVFESAKDEAVKAKVTIDGKDYFVIIRRNEERNFDTSSDYEDREHPMGLPKLIVFLHLFYKHGPYYFDTIRNWDKEKNKLLEAYGYSLSDDLKGKFEFTYKDGKPFLRVLDSSIKRIATQETARPRPQVAEVVNEQVTETEQVEVEDIGALKLGVVFNFNHEAYPGFAIDAVSGEVNDAGAAYISKIEKLDLAKFVNTDSFNEADRQLVPNLRKMQEGEISKYLSRNSPFSGIWENIIHHEHDDLPEETKALMVEYLHPKVKKLFTEIASSLFVFSLRDKKTFRTDHLQPIGIVTDFIKPFFRVSMNKNQYDVECWVRLNGKTVQISDNAIE